ncbi:MAG TPA: M20/M25/M40 family metallo-hydrolase [Vicinamibacterales bacterium]
MRNRLSSTRLAVALFVVVALVGAYQAYVHAQDDPVVARIIQLGKTDNQVMTWNDYASNRFGGRETGTNAYTDATAWAAWQFKQFGLEAELEEVGEVPVGFNRGPWFGKMVKPTDKALRFGTPTYTAGTKGVQRGPVVILKADPFSIPGRNAKPDDVEKKRAAVQVAIAEVNANKAIINGAWVLIPGASTGFARDGRRSTKEYADAQLIPALTKALVDAGALGTIQSAKEPISMLDGNVQSWDKLPVLPDIKLLDTQYTEIKDLVEKKQPVELEFDIRNWFKMGPIKYHNVVATLRGSTYPDEYVVVGGHFDCFSSATGGVDDGSGFAPGMEALRLIKAAGARPKRTIVMILFAAEENGLVGSQAWLKKHPEVQPKVVVMINRDGSPSAITGAAVPSDWYGDFEKVVAPVLNVNQKWPFKLTRNIYPGARPETPGGSDYSSFAMLGIPTLSFRTETDYTYSRAWHTLNDTYSELVPYIEHQRHSALVTAVVAYGVANLDKPLPRAGIYLPDGLYADMSVGSGDAQKRVMASLDFVNAPVHTANFIRILEGKTGPPAAGGRGPMGPGGPAGAARPDAPQVGKILETKGGAIAGIVASDTQKAAAVAVLPKERNTAIRHDVAGVLGMSAPSAFYLTTEKKAAFDKKNTAIGKIIAGAGLLQDIKKDDAIRTVRFIRVGQAAKDFKVDDESFKTLVAAAGKKK